MGMIAPLRLHCLSQWLNTIILQLKELHVFGRQRHYWLPSLKGHARQHAGGRMARTFAFLVHRHAKTLRFVEPWQQMLEYRHADCDGRSIRESASAASEQ